VTGQDDYAHLLAHEHVSLRSAAELDLWTETLDIYVADVVMAVAEVGNVSADVLAYLLAHGIVGHRSRTPEPSPRSPRQLD
jgi:hypothetical protein